MPFMYRDMGASYDYRLAFDDYFNTVLSNACRGTRLRLLPVHDTPEVDSGEQEALTLKLCENGLHYRMCTWSQNAILALTGEQVAGYMTCPRTGLYHQSQRRP